MTASLTCAAFKLYDTQVYIPAPPPASNAARRAWDGCIVPSALHVAARARALAAQTAQVPAAGPRRAAACCWYKIVSRKGTASPLCRELGQGVNQGCARESPRWHHLLLLGKMLLLLPVAVAEMIPQFAFSASESAPGLGVLPQFPAPAPRRLRWRAALGPRPPASGCLQ